MGDQFENFKNSKLGTDVLNMSDPGKIALIFVLIRILSILFKKYRNYDKVFDILRIALIGVIYIFLLNWLCSNNMCWASWIIVSVQLIYVLTTLLMLFSIIGFVVSLRDKIRYNNK